MYFYGIFTRIGNNNASNIVTLNEISPSLYEKQIPFEVPVSIIYPTSPSSSSSHGREYFI
jgi:hypothetical protein